MGKKVQEQGIVLMQEQLSSGIFSLLLGAGQIARLAVPGQFVNVYSGDRSRMLPRPISICEVDAEKGTIRLVYRVSGEGTREFSHLLPSETVDLLGPIGNGYPLEQMNEEKHALLIGGGIGVPPLVELAKRLPGRKTAVIGYRDANLFLTKELEAHAQLVIATEDGSVGTQGNVLDAIREHQLSADVIYACGPTPMLRALKAWAGEQGIPCYLSLEERMACGVGACLACVCKTREKDEHSQVNNKRVCVDGPVFLADEIEL